MKSKASPTIVSVVFKCSCGKFGGDIIQETNITAHYYCSCGRTMRLDLDFVNVPASKKPGTKTK